MSREIEFRVWLKEYQKMIQVIDLDFDYQQVGIDDFTSREYGTYLFINFRNIELMQYIGLRDKNGVKIFEGDILKYPDNDDPYCMGVVEYGHFNCSCCHAVFGFTTVNNKGYEIDMLVANENNCTPLYEVIGNIYENPELLESKYA